MLPQPDPRPKGPQPNFCELHQASVLTQCLPMVAKINGHAKNQKANSIPICLKVQVVDSLPHLAGNSFSHLHAGSIQKDVEHSWLSFSHCLNHRDLNAVAKEPSFCTPIFLTTVVDVCDCILTNSRLDLTIGHTRRMRSQTMCRIAVFDVHPVEVSAIQENLILLC